VIAGGRINVRKVRTRDAVKDKVPIGPETGFPTATIWVSPAVRIDPGTKIKTTMNRTNRIVTDPTFTDWGD